MLNTNSLYIHIPFCRKKCIYCDFYSIVYEDDIASDYIKSLIAQIQKLKSSFETIYIGGGTPSVLSAESLRKLLGALAGISKNATEFTIEVNPESINEEKLKLFKEFYVNRISIGVQSFNDEKLRCLGRIHDSEKAIKAIFQAQKFFSNISIDLIFGVWQETFSDWKNELYTAADLKINHISCYGLTYEPCTCLFKLIKDKTVIPVPENLCSRMYKYAMAYLPSKDFLQYEVSNFAKYGFECKHNMNYWENNSYVGLGAGAVTFREGIRMKNIPNVKEYIKFVMAGKPAFIEKEKLSKERRARETAAIKIRTKEGINFDWFRKKTGFVFESLEKDSLDSLISHGLIEYHAKTKSVRLTNKGFLFCDNVSSRFV